MPIYVLMELDGSTRLSQSVFSFSNWKNLMSEQSELLIQNPAASFLNSTVLLSSQVKGYCLLHVSTFHDPIRKACLSKCVPHVVSTR